MIDLGGRPPNETEQLAEYLDAYLRFMARGHVLVRRCIGKGLARLAEREGFAQLGYGCLTDYVAQNLGYAGRHAQDLAWVEREIVRFPKMEAAYEAGRLKFSHVRVLLRHLDPADDAEWSEAAQRMTVEDLEGAMREYRTARWVNGQHSTAPELPAFDELGQAVQRPDFDDKESGRWVQFSASPALAAKWFVGLELTRRLGGSELPVANCVEQFIAEFLTTERAMIAAENVPESVEYPPQPEPVAASFRTLASDWRDIARDVAALSEHWAHLSWVVPEFPGLDLPEYRADHHPEEISKRLKQVVRLSQRLDSDFMHLLAPFARGRLHDYLDFPSLDTYAEERLGMSPSAARSLVWLARRLESCPRVAEAFRSGSITQAQAATIVTVTNKTQQDAWLQRARSTTTKLLRQDAGVARRSEGFEPPPQHRPAPRSVAPVGVQSCAPETPFKEQLAVILAGVDADYGSTSCITIRFKLPAELCNLWNHACRVTEEVVSACCTVADCIEEFLDAFLEQWGAVALAEIRKHPILERDGWKCANPTCCRRAHLEVHHVVFRSHGGDKTSINEITLCRRCHQYLLHNGLIRLRGEAPHDLLWELGVRDSVVPHLVILGRRIVSIELELARAS